MLKKYTPPYITILFIACIVNIIFSSYFISFFLAGVVFKILTIAIKEEYNYVFMLSILSFLIIENSQGLKLFSLTIIALLVYYFIIPRIKHLFSSSLIGDLLYIFSFYLLYYMSIQLYSVFDVAILIIFLINFAIDLIIVGFIL